MSRFYPLVPSTGKKSHAKFARFAKVLILKHFKPQRTQRPQRILFGETQGVLCGVTGNRPVFIYKSCQSCKSCRKTVSLFHLPRPRQAGSSLASGSPGTARPTGMQADALRGRRPGGGVRRASGEAGASGISDFGDVRLNLRGSKREGQACEIPCWEFVCPNPKTRHPDNPKIRCHSLPRGVSPARVSGIAPVWRHQRAQWRRWDGEGRASAPRNRFRGNPFVAAAVKKSHAKSAKDAKCRTLKSIEKWQATKNSKDARNLVRIDTRSFVRGYGKQTCFHLQILSIL